MTIKFKDYEELISKFWPVFIFGFVVFCLITNEFFQSKIEDGKKYNFVITKTYETPTKSLVVYNGSKEISFCNFSLRSHSNIEVGDSIVKEKYSKYLYILRKNVDGSYSEIKKETYNGLCPQWLFSNR